MKWASAVAAVSGGLVAGPLLLELALDRQSHKFGLLAPDAFYYFTVARNISRLGAISFDQEHATNGFHPLWQAITALLHFVIDRAGVADEHLLDAALVLGAALVGGGVFLLGRAAARERGWLTPLFALLPLGGLSLFCLPWLHARWGYEQGRIWSSLWNAVNGMETGCVIAIYGVLALLYVKGFSKLGDFARFGAALALLALARLDHGVFSLALLAWVALEQGFSRPALRSLAVMFACFAGPLVLYLAFNRAYAGLWLPISGSLKTTFPKFTSSNMVVLYRLLFESAPFSRTQAMRGMLLFPPMFFALAYLPYAFRVKPAGPEARGIVIHLREGFGRYEAFLGATAFGVLGLGLYDTLFVPLMSMGHWYFPISTLFVSLVLVRALSEVPVSRRLSPRHARALAGLGLGASSLAVLAIYLGYRPPNLGKPAADFYHEEAPRVVAHYRGALPKLIAFDDGLIAYATGAPAMSGMGLALDRGAIEAAGGVGMRRRKKENRLLELGFERGFLRFASFGYVEANLKPNSTDKEIRQRYKSLIGRTGKGYQFAVEYLSRDRRFAIIVAQPKRAAP